MVLQPVSGGKPFGFSDLIRVQLAAPEPASRLLLWYDGGSGGGRSGAKGELNLRVRALRLRCFSPQSV